MFSSLLPRPKNCTHETIKVVLPQRAQPSTATVLPALGTDIPPNNSSKTGQNIDKFSDYQLNNKELYLAKGPSEYGKLGETVQAAFEDTVPLKVKYPKLRHFFPRFTLETCPDDSLASCVAKTKRIIDEILLKKEGGDPLDAETASFISYTASSLLDTTDAPAKTLEIRKYKEDPMLPPKFKLRKNREKDPSPPPPILKPQNTQKITKDVKDKWHIPSAVSNWKNNQGFAISLDKRVHAASGGSTNIGPQINLERFGELSLALESADKRARSELEARNIQRQQALVQEQQAKETRLRELLEKSRGQDLGGRGGYKQEYDRNSKRGGDYGDYNRDPKRYRGT